jgi:hypothetical protein
LVARSIRLSPKDDGQRDNDPENNGQQTQPQSSPMASDRAHWQTLEQFASVQVA